MCEVYVLVNTLHVMYINCYIENAFSFGLLTWLIQSEFQIRVFSLLVLAGYVESCVIVTVVGSHDLFIRPSHDIT